MPMASGKGYRTFALTGQQTLTSGSMPNLNSLFRGCGAAESKRTRHLENNAGFYHTPDDIRRAVQKYMSLSASDLTRLNDTTRGAGPSLSLRKSSSGGSLNSSGSSGINSPAAADRLDLSIRVSTPDESSGKLPPTGRGRPHSPNISAIRGPKLSVYHFNDDFTFDEDTSDGHLTESMLNDLTIGSTLDQTTDTEDADKTPMNSSNSDGGYVSSDLSDNTLLDSPKLNVKEATEPTATDEPDQNNNVNSSENLQREPDKPGESTGNIDGHLNLPQRRLIEDGAQRADAATGESAPSQSTAVSNLSNVSAITDETSTDDTMRFSELKSSEASSMASPLHDDDLDPSISYDIRINDTMGIPTVSTLKRQEHNHKAPGDVSAINIENDTILAFGLLPAKNDKVAPSESASKTDVVENRNWTQERCSSFSGLSELEKLKAKTNRSHRELERITREHNYVKRNDSFVKSIENASPWKGSWTARNVTFDETANTKIQIESRHDRYDLSSFEKPEPTTTYAHPRHRPTRTQSYQEPRSPRHVILEQKTVVPKQSSLARHLHNTSAPVATTSQQVESVHPSPSSLIPRRTHAGADNKNITQESQVQKSQVQNSQASQPSRNTSVQNQGQVFQPKRAVNPPQRLYRNEVAVNHDGRGRPPPHRNQRSGRSGSEQAQAQAYRRPGQGNINQRIVRQYYAQFYDQKPIHPDKPGSPRHNTEAPPHRTLQHAQDIHHPLHQNRNSQLFSSQRGLGQNRNPALVSRRSHSFSSFSPSNPSSPGNSAASPNRTLVPNATDHVNKNLNTTNRTRSARRKLQLTASNGDEVFEQSTERRQGQAGGLDEELGDDTVPRHPAIQTIQEPHRWVGR